MADCICTTVTFSIRTPTAANATRAQQNMRSTNAALLLAIFGCSLLQSLHALAPNALTLSGKRKPLVSREEAAVLQSYKRTKRQTTQSIQEFQDFITNAKLECGKKLGFDASELEKSFLYEDHPTPREKCLMECVLKRLEIMGSNNKIYIPGVGRIAEVISSNNPLVVSIATASAENCKKFISAQDPCEAAFQINKCIANEMRMRNMKLNY